MSSMENGSKPPRWSDKKNPCQHEEETRQILFKEKQKKGWKGGRESPSPKKDLKESRSAFLLCN